MREINCRRPRSDTAFRRHAERCVAALLRERAQLEEEVRQLRAAVQIWKAVAGQDSATGYDAPDRSA
jgi:hypothetical protein